MGLWITVALVQLIALLSPGPDFVFVSQTAARRSRSAALGGVLGIATGVAIWAALALLGLHLLFERLTWLQRWVQIAGGLYLGWLGLRLMRAALQSPPLTAAESMAEADRRHVGGGFVQGLLTNLANPKVMVYFGSMFSAFVGTQSGLAIRLGLWALVVLETLAWFSVVAAVFGLPVMRAWYARAGRWLDGLAGLIFFLFALGLLWHGWRG